MKRAFLILLLIAIVTVFAFLSIQIFVAPKSSASKSVILFIPPGSTMGSIAEKLEDHGVISKALYFKIVTRILQTHRNLKPGEYEFYPPTSSYLAMKKIVSGEIYYHSITFPEGLRAKEVFELLDQRRLGKREIYEKLFTDPGLIQAFHLPSNNLEGFLFPETYRFSKLDSEEVILRKMIQEFFQNITDADRERARKLNLSFLEWITLASMIEKESSIPAEHRLVSSVFHNRLRKKMRLQSDPTVIYGIPDFDGNITKKHLQTPTSFNTYTIRGLPPGPIANPGRSAIQAAVHPEETQYLFFVARKDGTHSFSETYEEHKKRVTYYQLGRGKKPD